MSDTSSETLKYTMRFSACQRLPRVRSSSPMTNTLELIDRSSIFESSRSRSFAMSAIDHAAASLRSCRQAFWYRISIQNLNERRWIIHQGFSVCWSSFNGKSQPSLFRPASSSRRCLNDCTLNTLQMKFSIRGLAVVQIAK